MMADHQVIIYSSKPMLCQAWSALGLVSIHRRNLSKSTELAGTLFKTRFYDACRSTQPGFALKADCISILHQPKAFYDTLLQMISRARKRIYISSLYIGAEEKELFAHLHAALERHSDLQVTIHVDKLRSTRPGNDSPIWPLLNLVNSYPSRVQVFLFQPPTLKRYFSWAIPRRFDEGWGTWHAKLYGVDDELILSGANLNRTYFTNRQDRYMHIRDQPKLAAYCTQFLDLFSKFSYRLESQGPTSPPPGDLPLLWENHVRRTRMKGSVRKAVLDLHSSFTRSSDASSDEDTVIFPYVQSGSLGLSQEEELLGRLFSPPGDERERHFMDLTTGYFAFYPPYQHQLINSLSDCRILVASPLANGFYKSKGVSGLIPEGYTLLEKEFWERVTKSSRQWIDDRGGISLNEWTKPGWTYHAKGIWLSRSIFEHPYMTIIGSSNLNTRSAHLDTELGFAIFTRSAALRQDLHNERAHLLEASQKVDFDTWANPERRIRPLARLLVRCGVDKML